MNLFYRSAESRNGSQKKILEALRKNNFFQHCVLVDFSHGIDRYENSCYTILPSGLCYLNYYEQLCDVAVIPEPDIELLSEMEKYKPTFMHIAGLRPYGMYTEDYFSIDLRYFTALRFWNYILDKHEISMAFFACIPHWEWEYMVYALCKCKAIPTLLFYGTHIPNVSCVGTSIDGIGLGTARVMRENAKLQGQMDLSGSLLNQYIDDFLKKASGNHSKNSLRGKKKQHNDFYKSWKKDKNSKWNLCRRILRDIKFGKDVMGSLKAAKLVNIARRDAKGILFYNSIACKGVKDEPFVYFALQLTPEATILPWGGIFQNQLISIHMLAEMGRKYGFKVYVKEHFVQPCRPQAFYKQLQKIPEVVLIGAYVDSYELILNSIANATQTGTVISESVIKGKPVISFVESFWSGADNVYVIKSKGDLDDAFVSIFQRNIEKEEAKINQDKFFQAIAATCIRWKLDYNESVAIYDDDMVEDVVDVFGQFIESGMSDSFVYVRKECRECGQKEN